MQRFKKYILFQWDTYYPAGGLGNITDSFETIDEAKAAIEAKAMDNNEVIDRDTWEAVWSK